MDDSSIPGNGYGYIREMLGVLRESQANLERSVELMRKEVLAAVQDQKRESQDFDARIRQLETESEKAKTERRVHHFWVAGIYSLALALLSLFGEKIKKVIGL